MEGTIGKEGEVEKENWGGKIVKRGGESGRSLRGECRDIKYQYDSVIATHFGGIESGLRSGRKSIAFKQT